MATLIPCSVDTTPMADELQSVSNHVKGTTAAVVTMQTAVIAAENDGAGKVCSNVNRGFFTLMRSQISQKIASKQSRVEALLLHLGQQRRQLLGIKANMEREYHRITQRYKKIFDDVNKELQSRITQLDQPVFDLVNKQMKTSSNRMNALSGWASTSQAEGLTKAQQITVSNMKRNAQLALEQTTDFLEQIGEQRVLARKIIISNPTGNEDRDFRIPVIIWEAKSDASGATRAEVVAPNALPRINAVEINNAVRSSSDDLHWSYGAQSPQVSVEFVRLVDSSNSKDRVKGMAKRLFEQSNYEAL
jgi:hypothetical protein